MLIFWTIVRILAAVVAAFVGWLTTGLVVRLLTRLVLRRRAPGPVVLLARIAGAVAVGLLVYYFLHPGGSGGWGLGGGSFGLGGGPGKGTGSGTGVTTTPTKPQTAATKATSSAAPSETLTIAMLGGTRYKGEGRYYLIEGKEPARTLQEVEDFVHNNKSRYRRLEILLYHESVASVTSPVTQLEDVARRLGMSLSVTRAAK